MRSASVLDRFFDIFFREVGMNGARTIALAVSLLLAATLVGAREVRAEGVPMLLNVQGV